MAAGLGLAATASCGAYTVVSFFLVQRFIHETTGKELEEMVGLRFGFGEKQRSAVCIGVDNIFGKTPPIFGDTNLVTFPGTQTWANTYDLYGRLLYARFDVRF